MSIRPVLSEIEELSRAGSVPPDRFQIGPRGVEIDSLLCADGVTRMRASPQIKEFYRYAISWVHGPFALIWFDPRDAAKILTSEEIAYTVRSDLVTDTLDPRARPDNSALFCYDVINAVYDRAYFVDSGAEEPFVLTAGSGVERFDSLKAYLEFWCDVFRAGE